MAYMHNYHKKLRCLLFILVPLFISSFLLIGTTNSGVVNEVQPDQRVPLASTVYDDVVISKASRNIEIDSYGLVEVIDTIDIVNNGTSLVNNFEYCIHSSVESALIYYNVVDDHGTQYPIKFALETMNSFRYLNIEFPTPLIAKAELTLIIRTFYKNIFIFESKIEGGQYVSSYIMWINGLPIVPYKMKDVTVLFAPPVGSSGLDSEPKGTVSEGDIQFTMKDVEPFYDQGYFFTFNNQETTELIFEKVVRTIIVNPWGYVTVREECTIKNLGPNVASEFTMQVNENVKNVSGYDELGIVSGIKEATANNSDGTKNITVNFVENRPRLLPGNKYSYTLEYKVRFKDSHAAGLIDYSFVYDVLETKYPFIVEEMVVRVQLESAWNVKYSNYIPDSYDYQIGKTILEYRLNDIISPMKMYLNVVYTADPFVMHFRPFLFAFIIMVLCFAYVWIRPKIRRDIVESDHTELPVREIRMFAKLYDDRIMLNRDMDNYEVMNKTNKVSKNEYKNYVKAYQLKIKESDKTIREFKAPLVNTGGRIQEIVERLDFLETQMDNNKASLEILEDRYKKGKIPSKTTYQDLYNEIMKKQDKNKKEIDKLITELKAFLI